MSMYVEQDEFDKFITPDMMSRFGITPPIDLYQLAYIVSHLEEGPILEIGTWLGSSAYTMAHHKKSNSILHLVDPFESDFDNTNLYPKANIVQTYKHNNPETTDEEITKLQDLINEHKDNLPAVQYVLNNFLPTIVFHKTRSENFELTFEPKFAFVDGGHTYEECHSDIKKIIKYDNTLIAVHDYDCDEVKQACDDIVKKYNRKSFEARKMFYILDHNARYEPLITELLKKLHHE